MSIFSDLSPKTLGLIGAGLGGILGATGGKGQTSGTQGYTGGIPDYTATRELLPNAFDSTDRRPGQAGRRYFTDVDFKRGPDNAVLGGAELAAMNAEALAQQQEYEDVGRELLGLAALQRDQATAGSAGSGVGGGTGISSVTPGTSTTSTTTNPAASSFTPSTSSTLTAQVPVSNPLNDYLVSLGYGTQQKQVSKDDIQSVLDQGFTLPELAGAFGTTEDILGQILGFAAGGMAMGGPNYLAGATDGMADRIPATIEGGQPAALSDGEFVIPADVVSHLGNGNSDAGANQLYSMMDRVRNKRTGTTKQGPEINPTKMMPA